MDFRKWKIRNKRWTEIMKKMDDFRHHPFKYSSNNQPAILTVHVFDVQSKNSYHVYIIVSNSIGMLTSYSKHTICKDFTVVLKHHKLSKCFAFHVVTVRFKISLWTYTDLIMSLKHLHSTKMRGFITGHCIFSEEKLWWRNGLKVQSAVRCLLSQRRAEGLCYL